MPNDITTIILRHFKDLEAGGFYGVTDCRGSIAVTTDKRLADQIAVAQLFAERGSSFEEAQFAIASLDRLFDPQLKGFDELTDRYWNRHGIGVARTLSLQLDGARAYALYGHRFRAQEYIDRSFQILSKIWELTVEGFPAAVYTADWSSPLEWDSGLELDVSATNLAATLVELGHKDRAEQFRPLITRLGQRLGKGSIIDHPRELRTCEARAKLILATGRWARAVLDEDLQIYGRRYLLDVVRLYRCNRYGGFWNRLDGNGNAHADAHEAYRREDSPFPIKRTLDPALLLLAFREYACTETDIERELVQAINHFRDDKSGGYFLGMGYFWSTPADPTVPFARQFWASAKLPGVFSIGNLRYLPLHIKTLETQIACTRVGQALDDRKVDQASKSLSLSDLDIEHNTIRGDFSSIRTESAAFTNIDIASYLNWLGRARTSSLSLYGLTAELSPLGFRADRAGQVFSTLHVVADLRALEKEIPNSACLTQAILSCQNKDGGFSEQPNQLSDVFATYCATISLRLLGSQPENKLGCIEYLRNCQNDDGGFGNVPGLRSDIWHSNLAILSLHALSASSTERASTLRFIQSCRTPEGAYSNMPGLPPDTFSVYRAISTLYVLGKKPRDSQITVNWLLSLQQPDGPFVYRPGRERSLVGSYMAIAALRLLGVSPRFTAEAITWFERHQKQDGGFGPLGTTSATTDESFVCIQSILILNQGLTDHWVAAVN